MNLPPSALKGNALSTRAKISTAVQKSNSAAQFSKKTKLRREVGEGGHLGFFWNKNVSLYRSVKIKW
jgi:hypothetical protein